MNNKTYYYARVSSTEQNLARQLEAFRAIGAEERDIIQDKQSGRNLNRPGYQALKNTLLREGDTLVIKSLDRLSRSKTDIVSELRWFQDNQIRLKIIDMPTTMMDFPEGQEWIMEMVNNILIEVLGTIAQQERETTLKRQAEGNAAMPIGADGKKYSLRTGRATGRPVLETPDNWADVYSRWRAGEITAVRAMEETQLKKTSFYKLAKRMASNPD